MKNAVFLFAGNITERNFEKVFGGKSAFELCLERVQNIEKIKTEESDWYPEIFIFASEKNHKKTEEFISEHGLSKKFTVLKKEIETNGALLSEINSICSEKNENKNDEEKISAVVFSWADCPFLNEALTEKLVSYHKKYSAEYTFADGYPYGFAPEIIDTGALSILSSLAKERPCGKERISRGGIFSVISSDINSFEIETVLADEDFRAMRFEFECSSKRGFLSCRALFELEKTVEKSGSEDKKIENLEKLCALAEKTVPVMKTVPAFYNVQISPSYRTKSVYSPEILLKEKNLPFMEFEKFKKFINEASEFSENAVISLSCFGEPFLHPEFEKFAEEVLSYDGLSLLIETDGLSVPEEILSKIAEKNSGRVDFIVYTDAVDKKMYEKMSGLDGDSFDIVLKNIEILEKYFPLHVYPQFTRTFENESQLESFYRFWNEKEGITKGKFVIQKYDSFCKSLPEMKPADLSPLERRPCWHILRDFVVLSDGSVPLCRDRIDLIQGNVFNDGIKQIWEKSDSSVSDHINSNYCEKCRVCDEYYTFNF